MSLETVLIVPDTHIPYHDQQAFALLLKVGRVIRPKHLIVLGDFWDFYAVSSHDKDPKRALEFESEIKAGQTALRQLKNLGATNNVFIAGNHEHRLIRYMQKKAPELHEVLTLPRVLDLHGLGFKYVPYKQSYIMGHMRYTHDVGPSGKHAAAKSMEAMGRNTVIGHCHRMEYNVQGTLDGDRHVGISLGWLGDLDAIEYMARDKVAKDWTLGFGIGHYDTQTEYTTIVPTPVLPGYHCVVNGKKVTLK